jgi:16S rRNA (adenine1518-N6/adenine1519-N6)-dimethyltransferase
VTRPRESATADAAPGRVAKLRPAGALALAGVTPHKSRGQNFLVQPRVADRIVAAAEITAGNDVIEIGPGLGILSDRLAQQPVRRLILIELDDRLATQLRDRFADEPHVTVINNDFLTLDPRDFTSFDSPVPMRVVANLPFNVAAAILERLCGMQTVISRMVLMFQREVAERIRARPGSRDYGALSAFTSLYWEVTDHFRVAAGSFHPKPRVDAEVLTFAPRRPMPFAPNEERAVLTTVRASFSAPRKTLRNAVGKALAIESAALEAGFLRAAIDPAARAATLAVEDFVRLARALNLHPNSAAATDA